MKKDRLALSGAEYVRSLVFEIFDITQKKNLHLDRDVAPTIAAGLSKKMGKKVFRPFLLDSVATRHSGLRVRSDENGVWVSKARIKTKKRRSAKKR